MRKAFNVLLIEDDEEDFEITRDLLSRSMSTTFDLDWARDFDGGLAAAIAGTHDVVLVDYDLRGESGVDLARAAQAGGARSAMILLTGHASTDVADEAQSAGLDDFISKSSLSVDLLERTMRYAVERRRAHAHLRESEAKYRSLFNANPVPTWVTSLDDDRFIAVNDAAVRQYGYTREEFLELRVGDLVAPRLADDTLLTSDFPESVPVVHRRKDGSQIDAQLLVEEVTFEGRLAELTLAHDVTASLRAHVALRDSEERFRQLAENIPAVFFVHDVETDTPVYLSPAYERVFDQPVAEGLARSRAWIDRVHPDDVEYVLNAGTRAFRKEFEFRIVRRDGATRWIRRRATGLTGPDGRIHRVLGTAEDITDLRRAQQQAEATSKMEAVGRLAGGVAHDFNNILTAIIGEADALRGTLDDGDPRADGVREILAAAVRAADLTRQLLAFSRQQVFQLRVLDLNRLTVGLDKMLRRLIGEDVDLCIHAADPVGPILADASQVEQIIVNLAVNARDAMPDGGTLTIQTADLEVDESLAASHPGLAAGGYTTLSVRDTGVGMSDEVKARIFEPFFTTKERGQGTGLGLATVYGIVKQSNGYIIVDSTPGGGTTFTVCLPRVSAEVEQPAETPREPRPGTGSETILVVEDEDAVRSIVARALTLRGYCVLTARGGADALDLSRKYEGAIDAVVSDIVMPQMSGPDTIASLRELRPGLKVLYMSGYTDRLVVQRQRSDGGVAFLQKPFTPDALTEALRQALDAV